MLASTRPVGEIGVSGCDYEIVRDMPGKPVIVKLLAPAGGKARSRWPPAGQAFARQGSTASRWPALPKARKSKFPSPASVGATVASQAGRSAAGCGARRRPGVVRGNLLRRGQQCPGGPLAGCDPGRRSIPQVQAARTPSSNSPLFVQSASGTGTCSTAAWRPSSMSVPPSPRQGHLSLRVDFGEAVQIDRLVMKGSGVSVPVGGGSRRSRAEVSADLEKWTPVALRRSTTSLSSHSPLGMRSATSASRLAGPAGRGRRIPGQDALDRSKWRASNLFRRLTHVPAVAAWSASFTFDQAERAAIWPFRWPAGMA